MEDLVLIGGGGHCRSCIDVVERENKFKILGILDNNLELGTTVLEYEVIGDDNSIEKFCQIRRGGGVTFLVTLGQIKTAMPRKRVFERLETLGAKLATVISPLAYVSKYSVIDRGTIVFHHALINSNAKIGKNCIVNSKALVEHDAVIGDHCHISTAAVVNGGTEVGECSFVGSNSTVVHGIKNANSSFIKAGTLVK